MGKRKAKPQYVQAVDALGVENTFAGAVIGDNWVVVAIAHADPMGHVLPIRLRRSFFETCAGESPHPRCIGEALRDCWQSMGGGTDFEYSRFGLCLPGRILRSRHGHAEMSTHPSGPFRFDHSVVTSQHVRQLELLLSRDGFWPRYAICDLVPLAWALDGKRVSSEPVGRRAGHLAIDAHLVLAEHDTVREVLDHLHMMDVNVDALMSAHRATSGVLAADERNEDTVVIEIDRQTTTCTFFDAGKMVHCDWIEGGSYQVLQGAADRLNTSAEQLALWLNEREDSIAPALPDDEPLLPLYPKWCTGLASLVDLDHAARKSAAGIVTQVLGVVETTSGRTGKRPRRAILMGDDSLTLRAMMGDLYNAGLICEWRNPQDTRIQEGGRFAMPGMARVIGMMRHLRADTSRHPFLDAYGEAFVDRLSNRLNRAMPGSGGAARNPNPLPPGRKTGTGNRRSQLTGALSQLLF